MMQVLGGNDQGVRIATQIEQGTRWLDQYRHHPPVFACVLGFTETGLIPGISAAGKTPQDRQFTAIADAEFLVTGNQTNAQYPLPPLNLGISPVFISRAVAAALNIPVYLFNAGLPIAPNVPAIDLQGQPARCLSTGRALSLPMAQHLFEQGLRFGETLAGASPGHYLILGECVVGGTTTALGVLKGLNIDADGKVNSSHLQCNHGQKRQLVRQGLAAARSLKTPLEIVAAVGDPMQAVIAGMAIAASQKTGVMLAGGTQMLAVYALIQALTRQRNLPTHLNQIVVGTTRWVCDDPTADTVGLAHLLPPISLMATPLSFADSTFAPLRAYEQGFVKEGVGAGALAIAANLYRGWGQKELLTAIEALVSQQQRVRAE